MASEREQARLSGFLGERGAVPVNRRYLLVSDVDDTLLGDDEALPQFSQWLQANRDWLQVAYASGRFVDSLLDSIRHEGLPMPDALIGGVGTQIVAYPSGDHFAGWIESIEEGWRPAELRRLLATYEQLEPQPEEFQSEHKLSYYYHEAEPAQIDALRTQIAQAGFAVEVIYSSHRDLDVLPAGVHKGAAAAFLARRWEIPAERVIASGNSENDAALFVDGFRGVVVANAHDELKALGGPGVYLARQSFALGVLEGIEHWTSGAAQACS